jgi:hypothetical protein
VALVPTVTVTEEIEDPLKALAEVGEPDPRQALMGIGLNGIHAALSALVLGARVPLNVRQLNAKNVALYSWFVYRFHQVAELVGYSALELALKEWAGFGEWRAVHSGCYAARRTGAETDWSRGCQRSKSPRSC